MSGIEVSLSAASGAKIYYTIPSATTFAVAGVIVDNLDGILEAICEAKSTPRGPFDPPFSLTSRNDLQQVVNLLE